MAVRITYFVHCATTDTENNIASGWHDTGLSEQGIKQANSLREQIKDEKFDIIFCSDLKRASGSARLVFKENDAIVLDERLRECNYGEYNGYLATVIEQMQKKCIIDRFPGGESFEDVKERVADFLEFLKKACDGKRVALVSHKAPQLAIEVLLKNKTWEQAFADNWRKSKAWQPGWEYVVE